MCREKPGLLTENRKLGLKVGGSVSDRERTEQVGIGAGIKVDRTTETEDAAEAEGAMDEEESPDLEEAGHCQSQAAMDGSEVALVKATAWNIVETLQAEDVGLMGIKESEYTEDLHPGIPICHAAGLCENRSSEEVWRLDRQN
jgi:hypothetical protein